jgi:DNA-binding MarR family transcriptional regulator
MTTVKGAGVRRPRGTLVEPHVPMLAGKLIAEVRDVFASEDWGGLRQSHFRLLTLVPREGISVTDLAQVLGMTKQACGQFVTHLESTGHLAARTDAADRRVRLVRRTPLGDRTVTAVNARIRRLERTWARQVGPARYATFRAVLEELVAGDPPGGRAR